MLHLYNLRNNASATNHVWQNPYLILSLPTVSSQLCYFLRPTLLLLLTKIDVAHMEKFLSSIIMWKTTFNRKTLVSLHKRWLLNISCRRVIEHTISRITGTMESSKYNYKALQLWMASCTEVCELQIHSNAFRTVLIAILNPGFNPGVKFSH